MEASNSLLVHKKINRSAVNLDSIEAMTKESDFMVYGSFLNVECPGQSEKITCRYYKGQELFCQVMNDNEYYTIPYSVSRHINERCFIESHKYLLDAQGNPLKTGKKTARFKFIVESNEKRASA
jgi:hypothetical protein